MVKLDEGESFHDVVDVIFKKAGTKGLTGFFNGSFVMLEGLCNVNSN
jgi:hypothetical protein